MALKEYSSFLKVHTKDTRWGGGASYPSAKVQFLYSTFPANKTRILITLKFCFNNFTSMEMNE